MDHYNPLVEWIPPNAPYVKCNVGASWVNRQKNSGAAWILRNHVRNTLMHSRCSFSNIQSPMEAELASLLWAMESLSNLHYHQVSFETSLHRMGEDLNHPRLLPLYRVHIAEIQTYLRRFPEWKVCHNPESCSKTANIIALSFTSDQRYQSYIACGSPAWIRDNMYT